MGKSSLAPSPGHVRFADRGSDRTGLAWALIGIGAVTLGLGFYDLRLGMETRQWPKVEAEIVDSRLTVRVDTPSRGRAGIDPFTSHTKDEFSTYATAFRYEVDGEPHLAHGVERGDLGLRNSAKSQALKRAHPVGSHVTVVVDPSDPDNAYLLAGPSSTAKTATGVGAAFVAIGVWVLALVRRRLSRSRRAVRPRPVEETA